MGERLWNDRSLGTSGLSCQTCHLNHANFNPSFAKAYPHPVTMAQQRAGVQQVDLDEMVQFCMVVPMASQPLAWESKELAALTAYSRQVQQEFIRAAAANPCMLKPAAANPCNPCATKNPCAAKNPCATKNPCAGR
jgi:cytochrome c